MEKSFKFTVKDGKLIPLQPDLVKRWLSYREGKGIHVLLDDDFESSAFERFYWAHVVEVIREASGEHSKTKVHNDLKKEFLEQDWELLGQMFRDEASFKDLSKEMRHDFINRVISAYSERGLFFEDPELWKQRRAQK